MGLWEAETISPQRYLLPKPWNLWVLYFRVTTDCADVTKLRSWDGESAMDYPEGPKHNQAHAYKREAKCNFIPNRSQWRNQSEIVVMQSQAKESHQKPEETRIRFSLEPLGGTRLLSTQCDFWILTYRTVREWSSIMVIYWASLVVQTETWVGSLGREDPLEKEMSTHSGTGTLAWEISWTEEHGGLLSMGWQNSRTQVSN